MKKDSNASPPRAWESLGEILLADIIPWCFHNCDVDTMLCTSRQSFGSSGQGEYQPAIAPIAQELFGDRLITSFEASGWPGTKLVNHKARVYVAAFDERLAVKMMKLENSLFKWLHHGPKSLPEDICFFKMGAELPALISVTHERDAWILAHTPPPGISGVRTYSSGPLYLAWKVLLRRLTEWREKGVSLRACRSKTFLNEQSTTYRRPMLCK